MIDRFGERSRQNDQFAAIGEAVNIYHTPVVSRSSHRQQAFRAV
jgi:hypothetical protein